MSNAHPSAACGAYDYIFFDLDGTLTDPFDGITRSIEYSLEKTGLLVPARAELVDFIASVPSEIEKNRIRAFSAILTTQLD